MEDQSIATNGSSRSTSPAADEATLPMLLDEVRRLNRRLDQLDSAQSAAESFVAVLADIADERSAALRQDGAPVDERLAGLATLLDRASRPEVLSALTTMVEQAPRLAQLAQLAESIPDVFATTVDVIDDWAAQQSAEGVDVLTALQRGLKTALWLGQRISEVELERLGVLLRSDVVDPAALHVVGNAATALVACQEAACASREPEHAGLLTGLRALGDRNTRQSLAFAIRFSKAFGELVGKPCRGFNETEEPS